MGKFIIGDDGKAHWVSDDKEVVITGKAKTPLKKKKEDTRKPYILTPDNQNKAINNATKKAAEGIVKALSIVGEGFNEVVSSALSTPMGTATTASTFPVTNSGSNQQVSQEANRQAKEFIEENGVVLSPSSWIVGKGNPWKGAQTIAGLDPRLQALAFGVDALTLAKGKPALKATGNAAVDVAARAGNKTAKAKAVSRRLGEDVGKVELTQKTSQSPVQYNVSDNVTLYRANAEKPKASSRKAAQDNYAEQYIGQWFTDDPNKPIWYAANYAKHGEQPMIYQTTVPRYWAEQQRASRKISDPRVELEPEDFILEDGVKGLQGVEPVGRPGTLQYLTQQIKFPQLTEPSTSYTFTQKPRIGKPLGFGKLTDPIIKQNLGEPGRYYRQVRDYGYKTQGVIPDMRKSGVVRANKASIFQNPMFSKDGIFSGREGLQEGAGTSYILESRDGLEFVPVDHMGRVVEEGNIFTPIFNGQTNNTPISMFNVYKYIPGKGYLKLNGKLKEPNLIENIISNIKGFGKIQSTPTIQDRPAPVADPLITRLMRLQNKKDAGIIPKTDQALIIRDGQSDALIEDQLVKAYKRLGIEEKDARETARYMIKSNAGEGSYFPVEGDNGQVVGGVSYLDRQKAIDMLRRSGVTNPTEADIQTILGHEIGHQVETPGFDKEFYTQMGQILDNEGITAAKPNMTIYDLVNWIENYLKQGRLDNGISARLEQILNMKGPEAQRILENIQRYSMYSGGAYLLNNMFNKDQNS